jgi:hypothetical protein
MIAVSGKMCHDDVFGGDFIHSANPHTFEEAITEEFDVIIPNTEWGGMGFSVRYYDSTDRKYRTTYDVNFFVTGGFIVGGYYANVNGINTALSLPTPPAGFFNPGSTAHVKIVHYNFDTFSRTFINASSNLSQPYLPNTFSIIINNNPATSWYNLPQYEPLIYGHSNMMDAARFSLNSGSCVDNLKIYAGTNIDKNDLIPPEILNTTEISGCWNTKTGAFQCWVMGCQSCCEDLGDDNWRVKDFGCVLGKTGEHWLDGVKDWILDNIVTFILLLLMLILLIPIILRALEIVKGFSGNRGY